MSGEGGCADGGDSVPRKSIECLRGNRKTSRIVDKSGHCLVVKNAVVVRLKVGVSICNLYLSKSGTAVKYGTVKLGNGRGNVNRLDLDTALKYICAEGDSSVAALVDGNGCKLGAAVERRVADLGNRCGNGKSSDLGALECAAADLGDLNYVSKAESGKVRLTAERAITDLGNVYTGTKGNGLKSCVSAGSERAGADGDGTLVDLGLVAAACEGNGVKSTAGECAGADGEISESATLEGNARDSGAVLECAGADRLNVHGNGNRLKSGTALERVCCDVCDSLGNGVIALNGKGSVKDGILDTVNKHTVNGGVNVAALFNVDGGKLGKKIEYVVVVKLVDHCGKSDGLDVLGSIEDGILLAVLTAHDGNVCLTAALKDNGLKVMTVVECSLVDLKNVLGDYDLADACVLEYSGTKSGNSLGSLEGAGLCSGEYLKSYVAVSGEDKSSVCRGVVYVVVSFNLVNVDRLKVYVAVKCTRANKLNGVGDVDGNEKLTGVKCVLKNGGNVLTSVGNGNSDVSNLVKVRACGNRIGIVALELKGENVGNKYGIDIGSLGESCRVYRVTILVGISCSKLTSGGEPTKEHIRAVCVKGGNGKGVGGVVCNALSSTALNVGDTVSFNLKVEVVNKRSPAAVYGKIVCSSKDVACLVLITALCGIVPAGELITDIGVGSGRKGHRIAGCKILKCITAGERAGVVGYGVSGNGEGHPLGVAAVGISYLDNVVAGLGKGGNGVGGNVAESNDLTAVNSYFVRGCTVGGLPGYSFVCISDLKLAGKIAKGDRRGECGGSVRVNRLHGNLIGRACSKGESCEVKAGRSYRLGSVAYLNNVARCSANSGPGYDRAVTHESCRSSGRGGYVCSACCRDRFSRNDLFTFKADLILSTGFGRGRFFNDYPLGFRMLTFAAGRKCKNSRQSY